MDKILTFLKGKKTYLVGIIAVLGILVVWIDTGVLNWNALLTAILGMTVRAGISKINNG